MHTRLQDAQEAAWYMRVIDMQTGGDLFDFRGSTPVIPASNQKLITALAALAALGPDYRARTEVYAQGPIEQGELKGDLLFQGMGAVHFTARYPRGEAARTKNERLVMQGQQLVTALREAGIERVAGSLRIDTGRWSDMLRNDHYPSAFALSYNENTVDVIVRNHTISLVPMAASGFRVQPSANKSGQSRQGDTILVNTLQDSEDYWRLERTSPADAYKQQIARHLARNGVTVLNERFKVTQHTPVARLRSITVEEMVIPMGLYSDNFRAEMLFLQLGFEAFNNATYGNGCKAVHQALDQLNFPTSGLLAADGSGLSDDNRVSPAQLVYALGMLNASRYRGLLHRMLPVAGDDGTLRKRFVKHRVRGNLQAKTGTLKTVTALTGFITTDQGRQLGFSMIANHVRDREACWRTIEDMADLLYDLRLD